jgi:hypothetical protein
MPLKGGGSLCVNGEEVERYNRLQEVRMIETLLGSQAAKVLTDAVAGKWKKHREVHNKVELHKRRILSSRIANNIYRELYGLRETFLEHNLADKGDANRRFFDNWLADPVVEMGWSPGGGWTSKRIASLHADLEGVRA